MLKIGQQILVNTKKSPLSFTVVSESVKDSKIEANFRDVGIRLGGGISLKSNKTYYFSFRAVANIATRGFSVKLCHSNDLTKNFQLVKVLALGNKKYLPLEVDKMDDSGYYYEMIFTPNSDYDTILLELDRDVEDFKVRYLNDNNNSSILGYQMMVRDVQLYSIDNQIVSNRKLTELGFQAPVGTLFSINGEELRVGSSGIYEIHFPGLIINYFAVPNIETDRTYILDYKYDEN